MQKEVVAKFEVLARHLRGGTENNHGPQSEDGRFPGRDIRRGGGGGPENEQEPATMWPTGRLQDVRKAWN
jgi:hypothetical protein